MNHAQTPGQKIACVLFLWFALPLTSHSQVVSDSLLVGGHYRAFHFNAPESSLKNGSLVFILHGSGGNGRAMMTRTTKLVEKSKGENVMLVYPTGHQNYWNECRKAASSKANQENIDENSFFGSMIDYFKVKYGIDQEKVFAVGTSGGGHMCYKLALTMPEKFMAITAIIANMPDVDNLDCPEARVPISVMIVNGTADPLNPYEGGLMKSGSFMMGNVRSTDKSFQYWAALAGYNGEPVKESLPDTDPADGKTIERYTYAKKGAPKVVLLKVIGGKHDYPNDIDVHVVAWEFFKEQLTRK